MIPRLSRGRLSHGRDSPAYTAALECPTPPRLLRRALGRPLRGRAPAPPAAANPRSRGLRTRRRALARGAGDAARPRPRPGRGRDRRGRAASRNPPAHLQARARGSGSPPSRPRGAGRLPELQPPSRPRAEAPPRAGRVLRLAADLGVEELADPRDPAERRPHAGDLSLRAGDLRARGRPRHLRGPSPRRPRSAG